MCYLSNYMVNSFPFSQLYGLFEKLNGQFIPFSLFWEFDQGPKETQMGNNENSDGFQNQKKQIRGILAILSDIWNSQSTVQHYLFSNSQLDGRVTSNLWVAKASLDL